MKNKIIDSFFLKVIKEKIPWKWKQYKFTYLSIFKHDTRNSIVELENYFLRFKEL